MADESTCPHNGLYWYAAPADERGWKCIDCGWRPGEEPGYSPQHDRSHTLVKVESILHDLHEAGIIYCSNASEGDMLAHIIANRCKRLGVYDSVSIALFILQSEADTRHRHFWKEQSDAIVAGKDPRPRCHCGALAAVSQGDKRMCMDHWAISTEVADG